MSDSDSEKGGLEPYTLRWAVRRLRWRARRMRDCKEEAMGRSGHKAACDSQYYMGKEHAHSFAARELLEQARRLESKPKRRPDK